MIPPYVKKLNPMESLVLKSWPGRAKANKWFQCSDLYPYLPETAKPGTIGSVLRNLHTKGFLDREYREPEERRRFQSKMVAFYRLVQRGL